MVLEFPSSADRSTSLQRTSERRTAIFCAVVMRPPLPRSVTRVTRGNTLCVFRTSSRQAAGLRGAGWLVQLEMAPPAERGQVPDLVVGRVAVDVVRLERCMTAAPLARVAIALQDAPISSAACSPCARRGSLRYGLCVAFIRFQPFGPGVVAMYAAHRSISARRRSNKSDRIYEPSIPGSACPSAISASSRLSS